MAPLTVPSADPVARRKSSKGEKSKSVTRSEGEGRLTQSGLTRTGQNVLLPTQHAPFPRPGTEAQGFGGDNSAHTAAGSRSQKAGTSANYGQVP